MNAADVDPGERLYVITDRRSARRGAGSVEAAVEGALRAGARLFQLRDKERPSSETYRLGRRLVDRLDGAGARLLVNGRADLARCLGAEGVHRPSSGLPVSCLREPLSSSALVGVSAHDLEEARGAAEAGADFATLSPVYRSSAKSGQGSVLGPEGFERIVGPLDLPVFALSGIEPQHVEACLEAGAHGVAVMSGIMAAEDPERATRRYLDALESG